MDRELAIERLNKMRRVCDMEECNINCELCEEALDLAIEALKREIEYGQMVVDLTKGEAVDEWEYEGVAEKHQLSGETSTNTPTCNQNEEDILKFYYVESLDEYWIGQRCGTRYYGKWTGNCFTFGYSRYLPWGEHVVAPDTLWKEHTYPSEPKEISFNEWLQGFLEKECQTERTGEWVGLNECSVCGKQAYDFIEGLVEGVEYLPNYCPNCGAKMGGDTE